MSGIYEDGELCTEVVPPTDVDWMREHMGCQCTHLRDQHPWHMCPHFFIWSPGVDSKGNRGIEAYHPPPPDVVRHLTNRPTPHTTPLRLLSPERGDLTG